MEYKTTRMMEEVVKKLGEISEDEKVFVTGPHDQWIRELEREFQKAGLVGAVFISIGKICDGYLRGRRGVLLIDDLYDCTLLEQEQLLMEQEILSYSRR